MDLATGAEPDARRPAGAADAEEIEPHARELGFERELEGIGEMLGRGNSADRQLRVFTPIATSSRSSRRSRTRPRPCRRRPSYGFAKAVTLNVVVSTTASRFPTGFVELERATAVRERQTHGGERAARSSASGRSMQNARRSAVSSAWTNAGAVRLRVERVAPRRRSRCARVPTARRSSPRPARACRRASRRTACPLTRLTERT